MRSNFRLQRWLALRYQKCRGWMKNLGMSTQQKSTPQGAPPLPVPLADAAGAALPATRRAPGDSERHNGPSLGLAREPNRRVQSSRMNCQTRLRQTRWEGIPTARSTGADNAPQRRLTDKSGTKPIHINEETKARARAFSEESRQRIWGQRALLYVRASQHRPQLFFVYSYLSYFQYVTPQVRFGWEQEQCKLGIQHTHHQIIQYWNCCGKSCFSGRRNQVKV